MFHNHKRRRGQAPFYLARTRSYKERIDGIKVYRLVLWEDKRLAASGGGTVLLRLLGDSG